MVPITFASASFLLTNDLQVGIQAKAVFHASDCELDFLKELWIEKTVLCVKKATPHSSQNYDGLYFITLINKLIRVLISFTIDV